MQQIPVTCKTALKNHFIAGEVSFRKSYNVLNQAVSYDVSFDGDSSHCYSNVFNYWEYLEKAFETYLK